VIKILLNNSEIYWINEIVKDKEKIEEEIIREIEIDKVIYGKKI